MGSRGTGMADATGETKEPLRVAFIKEGKLALCWTRLFCRVFQDNALRLQLFALAYNLANFLRSLALPDEVAQWSLTTLREKLVKIGARIVRHGRYVVFQLAEVAVPRAVFAAILRRIDRLRGPPVALAYGSRPSRAARAEGRTMRRDRPGAPEQPGSARRPGSGGPPHMGSAASHALRLTEKRRRSRVPACSRAHPGNVGSKQSR